MAHCHAVGVGGQNRHLESREEEGQSIQHIEPLRLYVLHVRPYVEVCSLPVSV